MSEHSNPWARIVGNIAAERARQDEKWGPVTRFGVQGRDVASEQWLAILVEEVGEAAQEVLRGLTDESALRAELVQVAAVAAAWIENIDLREGTL